MLGLGRRAIVTGCLMRVLQDPAAAVSTWAEGEYCWDGWQAAAF